MFTEITTAPFTLASFIQTYSDYNAWANKRLISWLQTKSDAVLDQETPSSFPTIRGTLLHFWETQNFWLRVMKGTHENVSEAFSGTSGDVMTGLLADSEKFAAYVRSLSDEELQEACYLLTPWFEANKSRIEYIQHTMNHSTYHRGQIITMGRNLGLTDAPMTDYNYYILMGEE